MLVHLPVEQLPPGRYQVQLTYTHEGARARAAPFPLRVEAPSSEDATTAAKLRAMVDQGSPSWAGFLARNWRTVNAGHLSSAGRKALALHLFLHRAIYGPDEPAQLDERPLQGIGSAEAALVRVELLAAHNDPRLASEQTALLARYPGLAWRVAEIAAGNGELTRAREVYGAGVKIEGRKTPYGEK